MKNYYTVAAGSAGIADFMARQKLKRPLERNDVELLTWALFQTGKNITSEETTAAWTDIALQAQVMDEFYQQYPILLTPTTAATAPSIDNPLLKPEHAAQMEKIDQLSPAEQKQLIYDQWLTAFTYTPFTQQANLFGHPALSVPTYVSKEGLPLGIQFNSALNEDRTLLQLGALFENNHKINQPHVEDSLNSSANQGTKSTESTHAFSNKSMIGKQEQLPKKVLPKAGAEVPSTFWVVLGGAFLVTSGTIYIRKTRK